MAPPASYVAFTAPINPAGATPTLTLPQIWSMLELKITSGETFVGGAITNTSVLSTGTTASGQKYTDREVTFRDGNRKVTEHCVEYYPMKVEFHQTDGSRVMNIISVGAEGEEKGDLWMTYTFEWNLPGWEGKGREELEGKRRELQAGAKVAVESTIEVMRKMVREGRF